MLEVYAWTVYIKWKYFLVRNIQALLILVWTKSPRIGRLSQATFQAISQPPALNWINTTKKRTCIYDGTWRVEWLIGKVEKGLWVGHKGTKPLTPHQRWHSSMQKHWWFGSKLNPHLLSPSPNPRGDRTKNQAMHNSTFTNPPIIKKNFNRAMQAWENKFDGKLAMMVLVINLNTEKCVQAAFDTLKVETASIANAMGAIAPTNAYKLYHNLWPPPSKPSGPQPLNCPPANAQWRNIASIPSPSRLPQPTTNHQPTIITKATTCTMNRCLIGSHLWLIVLALCTIYNLSISIKSSSFFHGFLSYSQKVCYQKIQLPLSTENHINISIKKIHAPNPHPKPNKVLHKHIHLKYILHALILISVFHTSHKHPTNTQWKTHTIQDRPTLSHPPAHHPKANSTYITIFVNWRLSLVSNQYMDHNNMV